MAVMEGGTSGALQEVGVAAASAAHMQMKPPPHGALGHYRTAVRLSIVASQAANSRLFEIRNTATNIIVITGLNLKWIQTAAHTAAILDSLDVFRVTGFTAVDTTNTVTPTATVKRTAGMAASPGGAAIRHATVAGIAAGMTGGTLTKDGNAYSITPQWLLIAQPTAGTVNPIYAEVVASDALYTHPLTLAQNEGIIIENRVVLGVAAGNDVTIECSWAELTTF